MKTKFLLSVLLVAGMITNEAMAFKIILSNPGRDGRYRDIIVSENLVKCKNPGYATCPIDFASPASERLGNPTLGNIAEQAVNEIKEGKTEGAYSYKDEFKVKYQLNDEKETVIDIDLNGAKIENLDELMEKYPSKE